MKLSKKKQDEFISESRVMIDEFKNNWDKIFTNQFRDYRRMANGELPEKIAAALAGDEYIHHSKLVPRVIPDTIDWLNSTFNNAIFNRSQIFDFVGYGHEDDGRADSAYSLVEFAFEETNIKETFKKIVRDALEVGCGFGERQHWNNIVRVPKYIPGPDGVEQFDPDNQEVLYSGPLLKRIRPEMLYLDPNAREFNEISAYIKIMRVPISQLKSETSNGGIYSEYTANVNKIEKSNFDPAAETQYDTQDDYSSAGDTTEIKDYPVLLSEIWQRLPSKKGGAPSWWLSTIANHNTNAQLIRHDDNPMGTGKHPLVMCVVYPKNDRIYGECVPEKIQDYMLEKFYKRNQRINYVNLAIKLGGITFGPRFTNDRSTVLASLGKHIITSGGAKIDHIKLDLAPYSSLMQEESLIERDIESTVGSNRVSQGLTAQRRETATTTSVQDENSKIRANEPISQIESTLLKPVAKGYLEHCQILMPDTQVLRIIGKEKMISFSTFERADILGHYDIRCHASSEILTKSIKQSLMTNFAQLYLNSPVRIDWQEFVKQHAEVTEIPNSNRWVTDMSNEQLEAERENTLLLANDGLVIEPLEHESHEMHLSVHYKGMEEAQGDQSVDIMGLQNHIRATEQMMQLINGQNVPTQELPAPTNKGEQLNDINTTLQPSI